jgi:hypothetical protein
MKKNNQYIICLFSSVVLTLTACTKALDLNPPDTNTSVQQYSTPAGYKSVLAKAYGSYSLVSSSGTGNSDVNVSGISDPGNTDFIRAFWNMQELPTDEAICAWNDLNVQAYHTMNWTSSNLYITALYERSIYQITVCNELIRQSADDIVAGKGFNAADVADIKHYRAEARFLRAYQYWVLMDLFGNPPFVTDANPVGIYIPKQISRADLFNYVESELKAIDGDLLAPRQNEYGRADQGAEWALLARLYLNAAVYTGTAHYSDAITYSNKVITSGVYSLMAHYANLFKSDNDNLVNNKEVILPVAYDAIHSQNFGGTTFLICSAHGTDPVDDSTYGIPAGGWSGNRSTQNLPLTFGDYSGATDKRALFGTGTLPINDVLNFSDGLPVYKYNNQTSTGSTPPSPNGVLCSTDFPLFRLGEMYLIYIESVARGGAGGDATTALGYFNTLRERAYEDNSGDVASYSLTDILNEREKELYWEGFRRTDLIRYGLFTSGTYLWPWKGGAAAGTGVDNHFNLYPIPAADIITNTNLIQNSGY